MRVRSYGIVLWSLGVVLGSGMPLALSQVGAAQMGSRIREMIREVTARERTVGLRVVVSRGGESIYSESTGFADLEHRVPVTEETLFLIASITKSFTGAAVLKLQEKGRIDLETPIREYVPNFPEKAGPPITPRLLLEHRGGVRHYREGELDWDLFSRHFENARQSLVLFQEDPLIAPAGSREAYSSYGFNLLAAAVETISGRSFPVYLRESVFEPLRLERTLVPDVRVPIAHRARSYSFTHPETGQEGTTLFRGREYDFSYNYGGGNILSTADDLARYGRSFRTPGFLSGASLARIYGSDVEVPTSASFGWTVRDDPSQGRFIHATGASEAFVAGLTVWIDHDLVVAIVSNTWGIGSRSGQLNYRVPLRIGALVLGG